MKIRLCMGRGLVFCILCFASSLSSAFFFVYQLPDGGVCLVITQGKTTLKESLLSSAQIMLQLYVFNDEQKEIYERYGENLQRNIMHQLQKILVKEEEGGGEEEEEGKEGKPFLKGWRAFQFSWDENSDKQTVSVIGDFAPDFTRGFRFTSNGLQYTRGATSSGGATPYGGANLHGGGSLFGSFYLGGPQSRGAAP